MRVTTSFNGLLRLAGASVIDVSFSVEGVIVTRAAPASAADMGPLRADRRAA